MEEVTQSTYQIVTLAPSDVKLVDDLGRPFRATLGFLPEEALRNLLEKGWVYGARDGDDNLLGYLIFAQYPDRFRITQLCVGRAHRGRGIARRLVAALKASATTQKVIKLRCRRDYPAHSLWKTLGFIPLEERAGRSTAGHPLTLWCYRLASDDELGLWSAEASDDSLDIVTDAQIFFDFDAENAPSTIISKGLQSDYLIDSLSIWITDELFLEIDRNRDATGRRRSMNRAHGFPRVEHDENQFEGHVRKLIEILPYRTDSEKSDIHQLAKTAASPVKVFVTKDEGILRHAEAIHEFCGIEVLHPVALITNLHEEIERHSFAPARVSGLSLCWMRAREQDVDLLCAPPFTVVGETKRKRREALLAAVANPKEYRTDILFSEGNPVAYRISSSAPEDRLSIVRADVAHTDQFDLYASFLVADCLALALKERYELVGFRRDISPNSLESTLTSMGFVAMDDSYLRAVLPEVMTWDDALSCIEGLSPDLRALLAKQDEKEFERSCAPLASCANLPCYLVPIRPAFAMGLLDQQQSSDDFFGGDPTVLLRWDNVYYRAKSHHRMLSAPGRILWYVSGNCGEIAAVSHLDDVEIGLPKELFKKYKRFGILEWRDIYNLCKGDIEREIMALRFSRTFPFRNRISLSDIRTVFKENGVGESLQAPLNLPQPVFQQLYKIGYPESE